MSICETCGSSFEPKRFSKTGRYCSGDCYYARRPDGPRKASVKRPRRVVARDHPLADSHGRVALSRLRLYDKVGPGVHPCNWCGRRVIWTVGVTPDALITDHLDWDNTNDDPANLVVSCHNCNARRAAPGKQGAIQPDEPVKILSTGHRTRAVEKECGWCGETFLTLPSRPRKFCSKGGPGRCANPRKSDS